MCLLNLMYRRRKNGCLGLGSLLAKGCNYFFSCFPSSGWMLTLSMEKRWKINSVRFNMAFKAVMMLSKEQNCILKKLFGIWKLTGHKAIMVTWFYLHATGLYCIDFHLHECLMAFHCMVAAYRAGFPCPVKCWNRNFWCGWPCLWVCRFLRKRKRTTYSSQGNI